MRFFLVLSFWTSLSFAEVGSLQVYIFKGEKLPKKTKVFLKDGQKINAHYAYNGFLNLDLPEGKYELSLKNKKSFESVYVATGKRSQVSYDLSQALTMATKFDDHQSQIDLENEELGFFKAQILSSENASPISGLSLFLNGSDISSKTDAQGFFTIQVPKNKNFSISIIGKGFRSKTLKNIGIDTAPKSIKVLPAMGELSEVVVLAPKTKGSIEDLIKERKASQSVSVFIGSEEIKKNGDSNAAAALKRVSGLSLVEGKYVYIRGLGERYSSTSLNGAILPSPNPSRRVVPLDMFPTSLIESVSIQKSYSVDKPAEFSAGLVEMRSLSIPRKTYLKYSMGTGVNSEESLNGLEYGNYALGGERDRWGRDDGFRSLPEAIKEVRRSKLPIKYLDPNDWFGDGTGFTQEELSDLALSFKNNYSYEEEKLSPDLNFSLESGGRVKLGVNKTGLVLKGMYKKSNDFNLEERKSYDPGVNDELTLSKYTKFSDSSTTYNIGGMAAIGFDFFKRTKLNLTGVVTRATDDQVQILEIDRISNEEESQKITRIDWEERELTNFQFNLSQSLFENYKGPKLDYFYADSRSSRYKPDSREYRYGLYDKEFVDKANGNERSFFDLNDVLKDRGLKASYNFKALSWLDFDLYAGFRQSKKDRVSEVQRFRLVRVDPQPGYDPTNSISEILSEKNIKSGEFQIRDSTLSTDNYKAGFVNKAGYASMGLKFGLGEQRSLSLRHGVRRENHKQFVRSFDIVDSKDSLDESSFKDRGLYRNYGLTYAFNKKSSLRFGFSETTVRPDLQEFSEVVYLNEEDNVLEVGNPDLEVTDVKNYDVRWDYYFNNKEFLSFGVFRKTLKNPIETIDLPTPAEDKRTFKNIDAATNDGLEFEARKHIFRGLFAAGNLSVIDSEVNLTEEQKGVSTSKKRSLQGQSPYLVNLSIEYETKKYKLNSALVYNLAGRRIYELGSFGSPDTFEEPFKQLDFTLRKKLSKKLSLSFKAQNILNPLSRRTQGGLPVRSFRKGRRYSLNLSASI